MTMMLWILTPELQKNANNKSLRELSNHILWGFEARKADLPVVATQWV